MIIVRNEEDKIVNIYSDDGKVFADANTGLKLATGRCNHIICEEEDIPKYIEVNK